MHLLGGGDLEKHVIVWPKPPSYTEGNQCKLPITRLNPEVALTESSSRPPLTDTILEIPIPQTTGQVIDITPPEPQVTQREGKGIATGDEESPKKSMSASIVVRQDPDEPIRIPYEIHGKANLVHEEAEKAGIDPKIIKSAKGGEQFKKIYVAEHQVLKRDRS
ncbi:hypothetical protein Tco_0156446 [Tanacetum coccineum]